MLLYFAAPEPDKIRFIIILRDSVDTLYSHYSMSHWRGAISDPFAEYVKKEAKNTDSCMSRVLRSSAAW